MNKYKINDDPEITKKCRINLIHSQRIKTQIRRTIIKNSIQIFNVYVYSVTIKHIISFNLICLFKTCYDNNEMAQIDFKSHHMF